VSFVVWQAFGFVVMGALGWTPLFLAATLLPTWAVAVRRLHDIGQTGKWLWMLIFWPVAVVVLPWMLLWPGTTGRNSYGAPTA